MSAPNIPTQQTVFLTASEDRLFLEALRSHIKTAGLQDQLDGWSTLDLQAGTQAEDEILRRINQALIIIVFIGPGLHHLWKFVEHALIRHREAGVAIVPVLVRDVLLDERLSRFEPLPKNRQSIGDPRDDQRWVEVVLGLAEVAHVALPKKRSTSVDTVPKSARHLTVMRAVSLIGIASVAVVGMAYLGVSHVPHYAVIRNPQLCERIIGSYGQLCDHKLFWTCERAGVGNAAGPPFVTKADPMAAAQFYSKSCEAHRWLACKLAAALYEKFGHNAAAKDLENKAHVLPQPTGNQSAAEGKLDIEQRLRTDCNACPGKDVVSCLELANRLPTAEERCPIYRAVCAISRRHCILLDQHPDCMGEATSRLQLLKWTCQDGLGVGCYKAGVLVYNEALKDPASKHSPEELAMPYMVDACRLARPLGQNCPSWDAPVDLSRPECDTAAIQGCVWVTKKHQEQAFGKVPQERYNTISYYRNRACNFGAVDPVVCGQK